MTLFFIKRRKVLNLPELKRFVLRFLYEENKMTIQEITQMEESIVGWSKKINLTETEQIELERIGWILKKNQEGHFDDRKKLFKEHNIDWRKFHRLPEAFTEEDFLKGKKILEDYKLKNPDLG